MGFAKNKKIDVRFESSVLSIFAHLDGKLPYSSTDVYLNLWTEPTPTTFVDGASRRGGGSPPRLQHRLVGSEASK